MTTADKAKRATVAIDPLAIVGFQMPNGSNFLRLNAFKSSQVNSYTPQTLDQGKAYAEQDALHKQVAQLEQQLLDAGLEPWQLPQTER